MVNKYVKQWEYECSVTFEVTDKSVEKLALMKNPPDNANCIVDPKDLRFIKSNSFEYVQFKNEFIPWLSVVDVIMFNSQQQIKKYLNEGFTLIEN